MLGVNVMATIMGAHRGEGKSRRSPPPPRKKFHYIGGIFNTFSPYGGLFLHAGAFFGLAPPPYENFCGHPCQQYKLRNDIDK